MIDKRKKAHRAGYRAEVIAMIYLRATGYRILAHRTKTPVGEIDLIVSSKKRLAFVEVKHRATLIEALDAVTPHQQKRIKKAAEYWLVKRQKSPTCEIGFDVVAVIPWKLPRHHKDAFSHTTY